MLWKGNKISYKGQFRNIKSNTCSKYTSLSQFNKVHKFTPIMPIICDIKPDMAIFAIIYLIAIIASRNFQYRPTLLECSTSVPNFPQIKGRV